MIVLVAPKCFSQHGLYRDSIEFGDSLVVDKMVLQVRREFMEL